MPKRPNLRQDEFLLFSGASQSYRRRIPSHEYPVPSFPDSFFAMRFSPKLLLSRSNFFDEISGVTSSSPTPAVATINSIQFHDSPGSTKAKGTTKESKNASSFVNRL